MKLFCILFIMNLKIQKKSFKTQSKVLESQRQSKQQPQSKNKTISVQNIELFAEQLIHKYTNRVRMEVKEQSIQLKYPLINNEDSQQQKQQKRKELKRWLTQVCNHVYSIGYQSYKKGEMSQHEMKIFCSENLLMNMIKLTKLNQNFTVTDYQFLNQTFREDILSYYKEKYPPTLQKQVNKRFRAEVQEIDAMDDFDQELVKTSKIDKQFVKRCHQELRKNNYNPQFYDLMMQFINHCLQLPDKQGKNNKSHYEQFQQLMSNIFSKVEDLNYMRGKQNQQMAQKTSKEIEEEQDYREKVREYTNYKIGRKIPEHVHKFTPQQIKNSDIQIKDPTILRFLTKWLEELEETLENIQPKLASIGISLSPQSSPFDDLTSFAQIQQIKQERISLLKQIQQKIYEQQRFCNFSYLQSKKIDSVLIKQKLVGVFSYISSQNLSTYIVKSINSIILDLIKLTAKGEGGSFFFPSITCKIGDLLRCKCSSKEKEILKIYKEIKRMSIEKPQILKIVRVINRLQKGTRDILINALFNNTILCQIQLSINFNHSSQGFLNSFNHYLYQLQRSRFGPINELASIWSKDQRFQHIMKLMTKANKHSKQKKCSCQESQQQEQEDPFICSCCDRYYPKKISFISHKRCKNCKLFWRCSNCQFDEMIKTQKGKDQLLKNYIKKDQAQSLNPTQKNIAIPKYGVYISRINKTYQRIEFKTFDLPEQKVLYLVKNDSDKNTIICTINKNNQKIFFEDKVVFKIKTIEKLQNLSNQRFKKTLLLPKNVKQVYKKQSTSLKWAFNELTVEQFIAITSAQQKNYEKIKSINLCGNNIKNFTKIATRFKNLQSLNLKKNQLKEIPEEIGNLNNLTQLFINQNQLMQIPESIGNLKNLIVFQSKINQIISLPNSIGHLVNLTALYINENNLTSIPQTIGKLTNLAILQINRNQLTEIPESIGNATSLTQLFLQQNELKFIPESIGNLQNLTLLILDNNKLQFIPQSIGKLSNLIELLIDNNQLALIPQSIGSLTNLLSLTLNKNKLKQIPQSISNLCNLLTLDISDNKLGSIPQSIGRLTNLTQLRMSNINLKQMPESITMLTNLTELDINQNELTSLPQSVGNLNKLTNLLIKANDLKSIPDSIGRMTSLMVLKINDNCLTSIPQSIGNLINLKQMRASMNAISSIPKTIENMTNLEILTLSYNDLTISKSLLLIVSSLKSEVSLGGNKSQLSEQDMEWFRENKLINRISIRTKQ